jgi:OFA family oxalate/formate antiporter-like MFS transporter
MSSGARGSRPLVQHRWYRLAGCIVAMMAVTNLQYAWTLFTTPLSHGMGKSLASVQVAFTLFVVAQTGLLPLNAYLIDRLGSRLIISLAAPLVAAGWIGAGLANSLTTLYISYALGGIGVGAVYGGCIGLAMKWFPDKRGLCVGIVAGSYGFGTAFSTPFISHMISASGYKDAFLFWGPIHGLLVLVAAQF